MTVLHSPAGITAQLVRDLSLGTDPADSLAWPVFVGSEPDTPDNCITVYDTPGRTEGRIQVTGEIPKKHGIQVRVRGSGFTVAEDKIYAIQQAFEETVRRDVVLYRSNNYIVHAITNSSPVSNLGRATGSSRRFIYTLNSIVTVHQL